jgi:hypothetical protein
MAQKEPVYDSEQKRTYDQVIEALDLSDLEKYFLRARWLDQMLWMGDRAKSTRNRYYFWRLTAIVLGLVIPVLITLNVNPDVTSPLRVVTIILSLLVAISAAVEEFFQYGERYRHYRSNAEALKNEGWRFFARSEPYNQFENLHDAYPLFVSRVSDLLSRDVQAYITEIVGAAAAKSSKTGSSGQASG